MPIIKDFRLELGDVLVTTDEWNYTVSVKRIKEKGKDAGAEYWLPKTYHSDFGGVAKALMAHHVAGLTVHGIEDLQNLQKKFDDICEQLTKAIQKKAKK